MIHLRLVGGETGAGEIPREGEPDATAFEAAANPLVDALATPAALLPGAGGTERWIVIGSDDAALNATHARRRTNGVT